MKLAARLQSGSVIAHTKFWIEVADEAEPEAETGDPDPDPDPNPDPDPDPDLPPLLPLPVQMPLSLLPLPVQMPLPLLPLPDLDPDPLSAGYEQNPSAAAPPPSAPSSLSSSQSGPPDHRSQRYAYGMHCPLSHRLARPAALIHVVGCRISA
jgi:hypothetical protein